MSIGTQLYQGEHVRLGPIDYEKDPAIESKWTHNSKYWHSLGLAASPSTFCRKG